MNNEKKPLYLTDEQGSVPPELARHQEIVGMAYTLSRHSTILGETVVGLRAIAFDLGNDRVVEPTSRVGNYTFKAESASKEELILLADFLARLNMKIWTITRNLGTEAAELAERVQAAEDGKFSEELKTFLATPASV